MKYLLEVFETTTGKLVESFEYDTQEECYDEMDVWDQSEYEFNLESVETV